MSVDPAVIDRITSAINFQQPDRVPIWESLENAAVYAHCAPGVPYPECASIACERLGIDATYGCMAAVTEEYTRGSTIYSAQTAWRMEPTFNTLDDLRAFHLAPVNERLLEEQMLAEHARMQELYGSHVLYLPQRSGWSFLPGYDAATFNVIAYALAEELPALERYWDECVEAAVLRNSILARHHLAPVVQCCEDVAYKTGLMVSPSILRDHFFPRFAKVIAPLKEAGIKVIWHSDGNIMAVIDDALAIGIDGLNPIDPSAGMDLGELKRRYDRCLILVGNVGAGHCLRFGTPEAVREDVRRCIHDAASGGGLLLQSGDGELMPDVPLENALAYFDEAHRAGLHAD